jgi:cytosine deaminase
MNPFMAAALEEARSSVKTGGAPVGSVLVKDGVIVGRGHNTLYQSGDPTAHAEMEAYRDAARRAVEAHGPDEAEALLDGGEVYTTMMPCEMCAGAIIRFGARRVVVGEMSTYAPANTRPLMERQGIEVVVLDDPECVALVEDYLRQHPERRKRMAERRRPPLRL